jgi:HEAT repeat protein
MRRLSLALLLLAATHAAEDAQAMLLADARAADDLYQVHVASLGLRAASADPAERLAAVSVLGRLADPDAVDLVLPSLAAATREPAELAAACRAVAAIGSPRGLAPVRLLLNHPAAEVRLAAADAANRLGTLSAVDHQTRLGDPNDTLRRSAVSALGAARVSEAGDRLVRVLAADHVVLNRRTAAIALGRLGDKARAPALRTALSDSDDGVRRYAATSLAQLGDTDAVPWLLMALSANQASRHLTAALRVLTGGDDFGFDERSPLPERDAAIARGFAWWAAQGGAASPP